MKPWLAYLRVFERWVMLMMTTLNAPSWSQRASSMVLGYADNTMGYRVYNLELNELKMLSVNKDIDKVAQPGLPKEVPVEDKQMEVMENPLNDVFEMQEDESKPVSSRRDLATFQRVHMSKANDTTVFRPEMERYRRSWEPALLLSYGSIIFDEHKTDDDENVDSDNHLSPLSPN
ncbi:unnamed protein product [Peronospora belbahrii]|uniref:Uncharacterized protein n=1 Tax=Peronospora belbahrii TaxID=622444 RepID=A0AAU9KRF4_9STRA|nr:unnamed protein product [Peronospora belbahrii]CAH0513798.1 unnamed protein product [Peronospora belbahrii]